VFEEKDDLLPFEEAKLYGHNAIHALLGSMAQLRRYEVMSRVRDDQELLSLGRKAFLEESGAALIRKHGRTGEPLFTAAGYQVYADDLLERMTNPFLHDRVERIIRDPRRKLAWNDRLIGTMRVALKAGIEPLTMSLGAAAVTRYALQSEPGVETDPARWLSALWGDEATGPERKKCLALVAAAVPRLSRWER
jgi:mannitol-1-phosphate 5-dehydrogenase